MACRRLGLLLLSLASAGCVIGQDALIAIPPHRPAVSPAAPAATSRRITVASFQEPRGLGVPVGRIGERKTVGDISLGMVNIVPPPGRLLADAFAAELRAAGHAVAESGEATLTGEIRRFRLSTDVTPLYWDVVVDAEVAVALRRGPAVAEGIYAANCQERTYVYPSDAIVQRQVTRCMDDLADKFRADAGIARLLRE